MKAKSVRVLFVLIVVSVSPLGLGCASNHVNLLKNDAITLEQIPSQGYAISGVSVKQINHELVIRGKVKRYSRCTTGSGHVDIAIVSPDRKILEQISTLSSPRIIPTKKMYNRDADFEVRLLSIPPAGSIVRTAYHGGSISQCKALSCEENTAESN